VFTPYNYPKATSTTVAGISNDGQLAGSYTDTSAVTHGFKWKDNHFANIDVPSALLTQVSGINVAGNMVGWYRDSSNVMQGFFFKQGTIKTITVPDSIATAATAINDVGNIVGYWTGHKHRTHAFRYGSRGYLYFNVPHATDAMNLGVNTSVLIVGEKVDDVTGATRGYLRLKD